jgi:hypothetical protein
MARRKAALATAISPVCATIRCSCSTSLAILSGVACWADLPVGGRRVRIPGYEPEDAPIWRSSHCGRRIGGFLVDKIIVASLEETVQSAVDGRTRRISGKCRMKSSLCGVPPCSRHDPAPNRHHLSRPKPMVARDDVPVDTSYPRLHFAAARHARRCSGDADGRVSRTFRVAARLA